MQCHCNFHIQEYSDRTIVLHTYISFQLENNFLSILPMETFHCACTLMGQIKHSLCSSPSPTTYVLDFHNEAVKARMLMARNVFGETKEHIF